MGGVGVGGGGGGSGEWGGWGGGGVARFGGMGGGDAECRRIFTPDCVLMFTPSLPLKHKQVEGKLRMFQVRQGSTATIDRLQSSANTHAAHASSTGLLFRNFN